MGYFGVIGDLGTWQGSTIFFLDKKVIYALGSEENPSLKTLYVFKFETGELVPKKPTELGLSIELSGARDDGRLVAVRGGTEVFLIDPLTDQAYIRTGQTNCRRTADANCCCHCGNHDGR